MRITITTGGSRGDLQPYVALGRGLKREGVNVRVATAPDFEDFVNERGLEFYPVSMDVQKIISQSIEKGDSPYQLSRSLSEQFGPIMEQNLTDFWAATEDADAVMWGPSGFLGEHVAYARGIPSVAADLQPILRPTGAYRSSVVPPLPGLLRGGRKEWVANRLSFVVVHEMFWQRFRRYINHTITERLGLEPMTGIEPGRLSENLPSPVLCGWSPTVLPRPADYGEKMHVTGYWFMGEGEDYTPPEGLSEFLEAGPPPVSVGFGSMNSKDPEKTVEVVTAALQRTGQRGVLLTGWSGIDQSHLPDDVFAIEEAPHEWLFPRMTACVHHGGAGTTAASLAAGTPTVTTPFFFDQRFWGERIALLGAGPPPILHEQVTVESLTDAISYATIDPGVRRRASEVGRRVQAEDGVANAVSALRTEGILP